MSRKSLFNPVRNVLLTLAAVGLFGTADAQNIAVNATGQAAHPAALLDVSSTTKGLLIPRMTLGQRNNVPIAPADEGLMVYQTNGNAANPQGFYLLHNGTWTPLISGKNGWDTFGNRLANADMPNPDFIGTIDERPMFFRTNNIHRMQLDASGRLAVGYAPNNTPAVGAAKEQLDINGALEMYMDATLLGPDHQWMSENNAAGTIRYQPFGTAAIGSGDYQFGNAEKAVTSPNTAITRAKLFGSLNNYPLVHASHWGNINGQRVDTGYVIGTFPETIVQPSLGGWRAFENPYTEVRGETWTHFREAECTTTPDEAVIPSGPVGEIGAVWSNNSALPAGEGELISPFQRYANLIYMRHQYLYFAEELDVERTQTNGGNTGATAGLCAGEPITQAGFEVNAAYTRLIQANTGGGILRATLVVRNAPDGLESLDEFDNSPGGSGMGCGPIGGNWPSATGVHWEMVTLTTPFVWDGHSNVIVEVVMVVLPTQTPSAPTGYGQPAGPVHVTELPVNVSYCVNYVGSAPNAGTTWLIPQPAAGDEWYCAFGLNHVLFRFPSAAPGGVSGYDAGASKWRPMVKFFGIVSETTTAPGPLNGSGNYITYPGALILEDTAYTAKLNSLSPGFPWSRWRPGFPEESFGFSYRGDGTISAQHGIYDSGLRLNDYVFDRAFDGHVAPHEAAAHGNHRLLDIADMAAFTRANRHLPTMQGRSDWQRESGFSLGKITNQLWATAEAHALYLTDLHDKLDLIEVLASDRPLNTREFHTAERQLADMPEYTDAEKARLISQLRKRTPPLRTTP